jgi:hypothetical protein
MQTATWKIQIRANDDTYTTGQWIERATTAEAYDLARRLTNAAKESGLRIESVDVDRVSPFVKEGEGVQNINLTPGQ